MISKRIKKKILLKKKADPLRGAHGLYIYSKEKKTLKITFAVNRDANIFVIVCPPPGVFLYYLL